MRVEANLEDMLRQVQAEVVTERPKLQEWAEGQIEQAQARLALVLKLKMELDMIGIEKVQRILDMLSGDDPDVTKPVQKVGIHGPGCECAPEGEPEPSVN